MNKSNLKSLAFYGITIVSVLLLFKTVTVYGESNLKAPPTISDRYRLTLGDNLPNCEKTQDLILNIQQSGIYVNASLVLANSNSPNPDNNQNHHSLTGIMKNQQLNFLGKIDKSILCKVPANQNISLDSTTMQIQLKNPDNLTGNLTINGIESPLGFTAVAETAKEESQKSKTH